MLTVDKWDPRTAGGCRRAIEGFSVVRLRKKDRFSLKYVGQTSGAKKQEGEMTVVVLSKACLCLKTSLQS